MLELLPKERIRAIKKEYLLRLSSVGLFFLLITGVFATVGLLPSYFLSMVKDKIVEREFENAKKVDNSLDDKKMQAVVKNSREMLSVLRPEERELLIKDLFIKIIADKNGRIRIEGVSANRDAKSQLQISLRGKAESRESLKTFVDSLKSEKEFVSVDLPISNFAKIADIDFNIAIKSAI